MDDKTRHLTASNLTIAFYGGQIRREPFLGEDKRSTFYSPDEANRVPTVSPKEVFSVYRRFLEMQATDETKK
ncbi:MAG TPA: hypothetical protein VF721_01605 [Pyrinomonadaceae bacterium]|jgi:hypothetical protein